MTKQRLRGLEKMTGQRNIVGERLKTARHRHDPPWTMQDLSQAVEEQSRLEVSGGTIGKIEAGIRSAYDWEVAAFAKALGISSDWLLGLASRLHFKKSA
ncbi:helix-turn-helix domain-containing protein [Deinococcus sp. UYEF24]